MSIRGRAHVFGDNVNTDAIIPTASHRPNATPEELGRQAMTGIDPDFPNKVQPGDVLVAGENFGCGSSREGAPIALKACGISAVVAKSFARTFFRNCLNQGLPIVVCPPAVSACLPGSQVAIDLKSGTVAVEGEVYEGEPFPPFLLALVEEGGIVAYARRRLADQEAQNGSAAPLRV